MSKDEQVRRPRFAALLVAALAVLCTLAVMLLTAGPAGAQGSAQVYRDQTNGLLVYVADLSGRQPGEVRITFTSQVFWFFNPFDLLQPGFGCAFVAPAFPHLVDCQQPVNGLLVQLGPGPNDIRVLNSVPVLPGPNVIQGNRNVDKVQGGQNDEKINGGKGNDVINPGPGEDAVDAGPQNDRIDTRDGEPDKVDGGSGKRDVATVDKQDKVKNVEVMKRK